MTKHYTRLPYLLHHFSKRQLHSADYFNKPGEEIVALANNAFVFAALSNLLHHSADKYPKIHFFYTPFWLDSVHSDYFDLDWGQTLYGLPRIVRQIFLDYRPNYPDNRFIKWGEFQKVRLQAIEQLASLNQVNFIKAIPKQINLKNGQYEIRYNNESLLVPGNSFFYSYYRENRKIPLISTPHTHLYELPRTQVPKKIIVFGHGLSIIWLLKHFPDTEIINIKRAGEKLPDVPANDDVDIQKELKKGRVKFYDHEKDIYIRTDSTGKEAIVLDVNSNTILHEGNIYAAAGLIPNHNILSSVPSDRKLLMPRFDQSGSMVEPRDLESKRINNDRFVAPKNIPLGSNTHSYTYLMEVTDNISWTAEPLMYYKKSLFDRFKSAAEKQGINLTIPFFNALEKKIEALGNPLSIEQSIMLYQEIFEKIDKPSAIEIDIFNKLLRKFFQNSLQTTAKEKNLITGDEHVKIKPSSS